MIGSVRGGGKKRAGGMVCVLLYIKYEVSMVSSSFDPASAPQGEGESPGRRNAASDASASIRILMVEDDAGFARLAASILLRTADANFEISLADTLQEAEKRLVASTPDVILLDLTLPDSTGMNTVRRILDCSGTAPVVILSGTDSDKLALEAIQAGAQDYIVKGGEPQNIVRAIRYAVERAQNERRLRETETHLHNAQKHLIHAEKMESIGTLAAGVAHEVKNPLAVLQMGIERMNAISQDKGPEAAETLRMMTDAVQRATSIIQRLLTFAAPSSSERKPADLHEIIQRAIGMIDYEIRRRHLTIKQELAPHLPSLLLDANTIEQVIINLLLNAAQASPELAAITIRTRQTSLTQIGGDVGRRASDRFPVGIGVVQCEIDDNGPGLSPEVERRMFQPFFTTKPQGEGTGLGLCVSRNILDLHGGKLEIYTRPGGGTRARITLIP